MKKLRNRIVTGSEKVVWKKIQNVLDGLTTDDIISTNLIPAGEGLDKDGKTVRYVTAQLYYQKEVAANVEDAITEETE